MSPMCIGQPESEDGIILILRLWNWHKKSRQYAQWQKIDLSRESWIHLLSPGFLFHFATSNMHLCCCACRKDERIWNKVTLQRPQQSTSTKEDSHAMQSNPSLPTDFFLVNGKQHVNKRWHSCLCQDPCHSKGWTWLYGKSCHGAVCCGIAAAHTVGILEQ